MLPSVVVEGDGRVRGCPLRARQPARRSRCLCQRQMHTAGALYRQYSVPLTHVPAGDSAHTTGTCTAGGGWSVRRTVDTVLILLPTAAPVPTKDHESQRPWRSSASCWARASTRCRCSSSAARREDGGQGSPSRAVGHGSTGRTKEREFRTSSKHTPSVAPPKRECDLGTWQSRRGAARKLSN